MSAEDNPDVNVSEYKDDENDNGEEGEFKVPLPKVLLFEWIV